MFKAIKNLFAPKGQHSARQAGPALIRDVGEAITIVVQCARCDEEIPVRLRKSSDIQRTFDSGDCAFFIQKQVVGNQCFNRIHVRLEMDARYRLIDSHVDGGTLIPPR